MIEPKLRFKAFSDELSHYALMDIIVEKPSNGIMNRQSDKVTAVKHINVIDMYTDDKIHVDELSYSEYGDTAVEKCNVEIGDIFLTRSSVKADGIAKSNILLDDGIYVYDDHLIRLKVDKNNYIPEFVNDYLASPRFRRQFIVRAKTTAFTTIGQGDVASCTGDFPSLPEQQKIADFLSTIDTVIEKQKETVSAWEERKKGMMQKLFSQEVRFKADDESYFPDWEEKKIDDLFYKVNERNNGQFGKDKWISVAKMYYQDEDKVTSNNIDTRTYVMRVGDMSFEGHPNKEFKYGRFVVNDIGDGIISELFPIYRHKENYILKYWKYAIQVDSIMQKIYRKSIISSGASSNKLDDDDFKRQSILVPCLAEQQKIADCLSSFDEVIEKQKATLSAWEELKKGLLQQMFV